MATSKSVTPVLNLIAFKGHLYPADTEDVAYLRSRKFPTYRIPLASLSMLMKTRFVNTEVVTLDFMSMWKPFMEGFVDQLKQYGLTKIVTPHHVMLLADAELPEQNKLDALIKKATTFVRRYCIALTTDHEIKGDKARYKFDFKYNEEINNSYAFVNYPNENEEAEMTLASSVKFKMFRTSVQGVPTIGVCFLDREGERWSEGAKRSGKFSNVPKEEIENMIEFLLALT